MTIPTPYEDLLREISEHGKAKGDRTGTGTVSLFGRQLRYDLADSFPLLTTKKVFFKGVVGELLGLILDDQLPGAVGGKGRNVRRDCRVAAEAVESAGCRQNVKVPAEFPG